MTVNVSVFVRATLGRSLGVTVSLSWPAPSAFIEYTSGGVLPRTPEKAMCLPSGDSTGVKFPPCVLKVNCRFSPPSAFITQIS